MGMSSKEYNSNSSHAKLIVAYPGSGKSSLKGKDLVDFDIGDFRTRMNSRHEIIA